jgi:DNA-binding transcriptional LysR family regulator
MEVRHLELLRELAARGTLAEVARATHRTPSALSQQLRTAERELGVALVEPDSRGIRLTGAGQILADGAADVTRALAQVQADLDASRGEPAGTVRIGSLPSAGVMLLPQVLARLEGSAIALELDDFDLAEADFAARTLDADIVIGHSLAVGEYAVPAAVQVRQIATEPIDVAVPTGHPLARKAVLSSRDLTGEKWIGVPEGYPFDSILIAVENRTGTTLHRTQRVRDNQLVAALVGSGQGLALLPRFSTLLDTSFTLRPLTGVRAQRSVLALSRTDRAARFAVRTVLAELEKAGRELEADHGDGMRAHRV